MTDKLQINAVSNEIQLINPYCSVFLSYHYYLIFFQLIIIGWKAWRAELVPNKKMNNQYN